MTDLASQHCEPCRGGFPPLERHEWEPLLANLDDAWEVIDGHHLLRRFAFPNFAEALQFVNAVGAIAEAEGHHPDLLLGWGKVEMSVWTHKIDGLVLADFVLAAKADQVRRASAE